MQDPEYPEQPADGARTHEIGNRTYIVADVDPLDVDGTRTVAVGLVLFLVAFVLLLPFYGRLEDDGRPGGCGPAWPGSGSASSAGTTAADATAATAAGRPGRPDL